MDATLEESATILKASRATIIRRVTIPIVMPAILSTFLLIFSSGFSSYTVPVFLGSAVKCYTLSTKMRALIQAGYQGQGYIIAFVSILLGCLILGSTSASPASANPSPPSPARAARFRWSSCTRPTGPSSYC